MITEYQKDIVMSALNALTDDVRLHPEDHVRLFGIYNGLANAFGIPHAVLGEPIPEESFSHSARYRTAYQ